jgi:hypothetical protein
MVVSGIRCTLTYIIFPIVLPLLSIAKGVGFAIGVVVGTFAIVCDVFTIRRFFAADHRYRWHFSAIALAVITLLFVLLAEDIIGLCADRPTALTGRRADRHRGLNLTISPWSRGG